jgi:small subunit ribosomal protein S24e
MKVSVIKKDENPLLKRLEVRFEVDHEGGPTPKRLDVRKELAGQLGVPEDMVVIEKFATMYGRQIASGIARAYDSKERLEELEPKYLLGRGLPKEEKAEEKPPEKEEKPKEKPEEKPKEEPKKEPKPEKEEPKKVKEEPPEEPKEEKESGKKGEEKA